jgi:hypothetical protein
MEIEVYPETVDGGLPDQNISRPGSVFTEKCAGIRYYF